MVALKKVTKREATTEETRRRASLAPHRAVLVEHLVDPADDPPGAACNHFPSLSVGITTTCSLKWFQTTIYSDFGFYRGYEWTSRDNVHF